VGSPYDATIKLSRTMCKAIAPCIDDKSLPHGVSKKIKDVAGARMNWEFFSASFTFGPESSVQDSHNRIWPARTATQLRDTIERALRDRKIRMDDRTRRGLEARAAKLDEFLGVDIVKKLASLDDGKPLTQLLRSRFARMVS